MLIEEFRITFNTIKLQSESEIIIHCSLIDRRFHFQSSKGGQSVLHIPKGSQIRCRKGEIDGQKDSE